VTKPKQSLLGGTATDGSDRGYVGKFLPTYRTTYPRAIREALHALAESNPTPETYHRERARILGDLA
jgi:hypothetical protein